MKNNFLKILILTLFLTLGILGPVNFDLKQNKTLAQECYVDDNGNSVCPDYQEPGLTQEEVNAINTQNRDILEAGDNLDGYVSSSPDSVGTSGVSGTLNSIGGLTETSC